MNNKKENYEWKNDTEASIKQYNEWFMNTCPNLYRNNDGDINNRVKKVMEETKFMSDLSIDLIKRNPKNIEVLRMCTAPPIAKDRLAGLSGLSIEAPSFVKALEEGRVQRKAKSDEYIEKLLNVINLMLDKSAFLWINEGRSPKEYELEKAFSIVEDRLVYSISNTIIKNAQEQRQLKKLTEYLESKGYTRYKGESFKDMKPGTFSTRLNVPGKQSNGNLVNIPVDMVVKTFNQKIEDIPILIECKEEAEKHSNLTNQYGDGVKFILFLCGYFGESYLAYEAAHGIDWVWEHRISDLDEILI